MQFGYVTGSANRVFYKYTPDGEMQIAANQEAAAEEYANITPVATEAAEVSSPEGGGKTVQQTGNVMNAYEKKVARLEAKKEKMGGGNTTVVNAPNNSVTSSGGGGSTTIPVSTRDNSSASTAAAVAAF
jgi:hypothetical protein